MRILLISTSPVQAHGGREAAGTFIGDLAAALTRLGIKVAIVAPSEQPATTHECWNGVATLFTYQVPRLPLASLKLTSLSDWPRIWQTLRAGRSRVAVALRAFAVDHQLALWTLPSGYWARLEGRRLGIGYDVWALGSDIWTLGRIPGVRSFLRGVLRDARHRYADGVALSEQVHALARVDCEFLPSSRWLPVSAHIYNDSVPGVGYKLVFLGRWHINKGVDLLLEALELLDRVSWMKIRSVTIAGGGPLEEEVLSAVDRLRHQDRPVSVLGYLDTSQAGAFLQASDFVLIPSRIESVPLIFSDAMQAGRPVVSMPVGDLHELVERYQCGTCASAVDAVAFAEALKAALTRGPESWSNGTAMAAAAFSIDTTASRLVDRWARLKETA